MLFLPAYLNKRDGCITRVMLVSAGIVAILTGLLIVLSIADVSGVKTLKLELWIYAAVDIIAGIIALRACV